MSINIDFVRSQFPALAGEWVFMDNAGGSQTLESVIGRIDEYLRTSDVQHGASYAVSQLAMKRVEAATRAMATFVGAADPSEIVLGPSTTMLLRILSICLREDFEPGDEVIVTNLDHEANVGPWVDLERHGIKIRWWRVNPDTFELELDDLRELLTERTRLVAVSHTSNVVGKINPIADIAKIVHDAGALICVDGVAYAPHRRIDVQSLGVDFYTLSHYKVYGPHQATLYGRRSLLDELPSFNHFFIGKDEVPYKLQPGNVNFELTAGMMGVFDYTQAFARAHDGPAEDLASQLDFMFDTIGIHEEALSAKLLAFLSSKSKVTVIGSTESDRTRNVPTVSFGVDGVKSDTITEQVDEHKIGIRFGDFYARRLIDDLGLSQQNGVVRVSLVHYNTMEEVDRLVTVLDEII